MKEKEERDAEVGDVEKDVEDNKDTEECSQVKDINKKDVSTTRKGKIVLI